MERLVKHAFKSGRARVRERRSKNQPSVPKTVHRHHQVLVISGVARQTRALLEQVCCL